MTNKQRIIFEQGFEEGYSIARRNYDRKKEIIRKIEAVKDAVRKQTGAFKYDDCYDDCIKIINNIK